MVATNDCLHDIENAVRKSRAVYVCPDCGEDISLSYILYQQALDFEEEIKKDKSPVKKFKEKY